MECGCDGMRGLGRESMGKAITKDSVFDSMRRVEAALKLRYMGIGFVWAWLYCTYATSAVFPCRSGQSINSDESWLLSAVAVVLGFFVGGLLLSRRPLGGHCLRRFSIAAALLLTAGTIVSALGAFALGLAWLGGAMTGVGYALLSLLWARALMVLDVEELEAVVPLSSLVIVPCVVVYPLLEGVVGVVATALLPLMSGVLLLLCLREGAKRGGVEEAASSVGGMSPYLKDSEASAAASASSGAGASLSRRFGIAESWGFYLGRVAVVLVVLYLAIGWQAALADVRDSMHALIDLDVSMLISSLASVALGIAIVFFSRRVSFTGLFRWAVPCVIITLVLHGSSGLWAGFVSNAIGDTLDSLIQVLVYLFAITLAKQGKAPVALGVGLLNGSVQLGVLFGNLAGAHALVPPRRLLRRPFCRRSSASWLSLALRRPSANRLKCGRWLRRARMRLSTRSWWGARFCRRDSACPIARRKSPFFWLAVTIAPISAKSCSSPRARWQRISGTSMENSTFTRKRSLST